MPLYVGDYLADTAHLTQAQHGAYLLLIAAYWSRGTTTDGSPVGLPTLEQCVRIARASSDDEVKNVCLVLAEYFDRQDDGTFRHSRIDEELVAANSLIERRKYVSRLGVEARLKKKTGEPSVIPSVQPSTTTYNLDSTRERLETTKPSSRQAGAPDGFEEFWQEYPRRVGKGAALKAWQKIRPDADLQSQILRAVRAQKNNEQWTKDGGKFVPHPTTWLNQQRWLDEDGGAEDDTFTGVL